MIDWNEQWKQFAPNFRNGCAHIEFSGTQVKLFPGPGFGDFSHPTTRLTLNLLSSKAPKKHVVDIGCGCGVLTLAAAKLGAKSCIGIDIEHEAVVHAQKNAEMNQLDHVDFYHSSEKVPAKKSALVLMNMIQSEQRLAKQMYSAVFNAADAIITSGILASQRETYLNETKSWGWQCLEEREEEGWLAFFFIL
jgi:ribosomal protein L11 methyltransferase